MRVLITGGSGFLGAWLAKRLLSHSGIRIRVLDTSASQTTVALIAGAGVAPRLEWHVGDIRKMSDVVEASTSCDAIVHLAGVLTPACQKDPIFGAEVNFLGTLNVFEAAKKHGISQILYTSSGGVYGRHPQQIPIPVTHYGAFKLACEGSARAYWEDARIASIGFRPFVIFGPGRETGLTAGPSLACRAAVNGQAYVIPFTGPVGLVYVDDVAAAYEAALLQPFKGASVLNLAGEATDVCTVIAEIKRLIPYARITATGSPMPSASYVIGDDGNDPRNVQRTSLGEGIRKTIDFYARTG